MTLHSAAINTRNAKYRSGFTIVELLIVIVVIAILAAITVVSYTNIQTRARASVAKSDLKTIGTTLQLYQSTEGAYPRSNTELLEALGRQPGALDLGVTNTGTAPSDAPKSFVYCYSADGASMWIAAWKPVTASNGDSLYFWGNGSVGESTYTLGGEPTAAESLCRTASANSYSSSVWSHSSLLQLP